MSCLKASIPQVDSRLQELIGAVENAPSLGAMMLAAWRLARLLAVRLVEEELAKRARRPTEWPHCERCGKKLKSKGFEGRQLTGLIGIVRWERRVGRCPSGCEIGQVAPLDEELGLQPNQRTSADLKRAACALAVFVPFEIAVVLLKLLTEAVVSPGSIWNWVQEAGQASMDRLKQQLEALKDGQEPSAVRQAHDEEEEVEAAVAALPLLVGADGVMVPFRPNDGKPNGHTVWREVKVAVLARLSQRITRTGKQASQLVQRRLVAVSSSSIPSMGSNGASRDVTSVVQRRQASASGTGERRVHWQYGAQRDVHSQPGLLRDQVVPILAQHLDQQVLLRRGGPRGQGRIPLPAQSGDDAERPGTLYAA